MSKLIPVILAGGVGSRLRPISKKVFPKQFIQLQGESLISRTYRRVKLFSDEVFVSTNINYKDLVLQNISNFPIDNLIFEPEARNTLGSIFLSLKVLQQKFTLDDVIVFSPSDQLISPEREFSNFIYTAKQTALNSDSIVLFGVHPSSPNTGYGYIKVSGDGAVKKVISFHEKPDLNTAQKYLLAGNFLRNSGIFVGKLGVFLEEIYKHNPELRGFKDLSYKQIFEEYSRFPKKPFDKAVLEKTGNILCVEMNLTWSDLGTWDSIYEFLPKDEHGNVKIGKVASFNSQNNLFYSDNKDKKLVVYDVHDLIIIDTPDSLFITKRGNSQVVKEILKEVDEK